nr:myelin and lymphocyte protein isoform X1 [Loxodonta africana]
MAPAAASGGSSLPSGFAVFTTFPDLLFILEFTHENEENSLRELSGKPNSKHGDGSGFICCALVTKAARWNLLSRWPAEQVFGGLVWILIASSLVPIPLIQGWVMFVSVFCFVATTALLVLYMTGAHSGDTSWVTLDAAYHSVASLFYLSASVLEALATIFMRNGFIYKHYHENISAVVFSYVATLLYVTHAVFSLIRWKSS